MSGQRGDRLLRERERRILIERRLGEDSITLEGLSRQYSINRERVRQIEARAFEKVRTAVLGAAGFAVPWVAQAQAGALR